MSKDLIIVESPAKVKTLKKFLGNSYMVEASVGHVRDLPKSSLGVDEKNSFLPQYRILPGKKKVVDQLKASAAKANQVYLAPDPDREGEAIAWHVAELIKPKNPKIKRIQFNEITKSAVQEALKNPRELDASLFNSQQARRILDRLVGYKISPLLWQKVKRGISAGRVQSVALKLIVEREEERQNFVPQEYWLFEALLATEKQEQVKANLWKVNGKKANIENAEQADELEKRIKESKFNVESVQEKERLRQPKPPFITSTLQQDASNKLNYSAKKTMSLAQKLYEGVDLGEKGTTALITYMRTDSVRISKEARSRAKEWILKNLGEEYYPQKPRVFKSKGSAQDAHEAIRPVNPELTPKEIQSYLPKDMFNLYLLIWSRFMASQAAAAKFWDTTVIIKAKETQWRAKGERLIFPGYLKIYSGENEQEQTILPKLEQGQTLELNELKKEQKFTQPPARYTEASIVRKLEELEIGRPSTYAQIISTLRDRDYVRMEKRQFLPTELGMTVSELLVKHFQNLMDVKFTANMEGNLDQIAEGEQEWQKLLQNFNQYLDQTLTSAEAAMAEVKQGKKTDLSCEKCGNPMVIKFGRNGEFLACSAYPKCKNTSNFTRDEKGNIQKLDQEQEKLEKVGTCPQCGNDLVLKKSRTGSRFIACSNYPKCKYAKPFSTKVPCPREGCSGELVEKSSKKGRVFYACDQYPKCNYAVWTMPVQKTCPNCGSKVLVQKETKAKGKHLACPNKECKYWEKQDEEKES